MTGALESVREALADRYRVHREIGRGATAVVYLADDSVEQHQVAIKVLHPELAQALGAQRFLREIRTAAAMQHQHLVPILDSGQHGDVFYYVAPYMEEGSLRARLTRERQLSLEDALRITDEVGQALEYMHSQGIIHRDIKPENILFAGGSACVADFGIARAINSVSGETITSTGLVVGTPAYMSPEQASGDATVDARSDQYSLACVLYEMLAGMPPFIGASSQAVIAQRFAHPALPLTHYRPTVPPQVEAAVARALNLTPSDRFPGIARFLRALADAATTQASIPVIAGTRGSRRGWFALGVATAVIALATLGFGGGYSRIRNAFVPALDTSAVVVLPFAAEGVPVAAGVDGADVLYRALSAWRGVRIIDDLTARDALQRRGGSVTGLAEALDLATELRVGRLVWGRVVGPPHQPVAQAKLYDVASRRPVAEAVAELGGRDGAEAAARAAAELFAGGPMPPRARYATGTTMDVRAWRAYQRGHRALAEWRIDQAGEEFASAVAADGEFASAHLWRAQIGAWLHRDAPGQWQESIRRAESSHSRLSAPEQALGEALLAMAEARYPDACVGFERLLAFDSLDVVALYGLGECREADPIVVRDPRARDGWRFRASAHTAVRFYRRALETESRLFSLPVVMRLRQLLKTEVRELRIGYAPGPPRAEFAAVPALEGDTLVYVPRSPAEVAARPPPPVPHRAALVRGRDLLLEVVREWVRQQPDNPRAHAAMAEVREGRFELEDRTRDGTGALESIRIARRLSDSAQLKLRLGVTEVRLLLKRGEHAAAKALADSLLRQTGPPTLENAAVVRGLAALTGRVRLAAQANVLARPVYLPPSIPAALRDEVAEIEAFASLGVCDGIEPRLRQVSATVASYAPADEKAALAARVLRMPVTVAAPCTNGRSVRFLDSPGGALLPLYLALSQGDGAAVLRGLDSLAGTSQVYRPGEISPFFGYQQTWLRTAAGDSAGAMRQLDSWLTALPTLPSDILDEIRHAAALPRSMQLRAELGAAVGDRVQTAHWARAVLALWEHADPPLQPVVERMRILAR